MQTIEQSPERKGDEKTVQRSVLRPPVECVQHRIYVWSSPAPYALVVDEARSWQPR